ncbi:AAA family ATPase [Escherichia coli]|nr:AAA family ATPase [Escherichia coli]EER2721382.1 AAA family ATPase [Escherichia coli]EER9091630.1 AAA family ATPase [Escherichia coli]EEX9034636.1 AAA family ATPase [Escherichia coli]EEZ0270887.1 AAA family ATPase [Escherichia coli]
MSFNAKDMTQGGQIASMRIRMFSQIANIMLYCLFIFFWILVGLVLWVKISWQTFVNGCIYWWCTTLEGMRDLIKSQPVYEIQYYGKTFRMNAAQVLHDKYMIWCGEQLWSAFVLASVVALVICLITFFVVSWILGRQGKQQSENEVTGGRQLTENPKEVARMLKKDGRDSDIRIPGELMETLTSGQRAATRMILETSDRFTVVQGYAGVGKTTQFRAVMSAVNMLPENERPRVVGLGPTHRAVGEMRSAGVDAQTLASFLHDTQLQQRSGETPDFSNTLFLLDESSMVGKHGSRR